MSLTTCLFLTILLIAAQLVNVRLARRLGWFDMPNERSMHQNSTTIRAGGVVFYLAALGAWVLGGFNQPYFLVGLTAAALVGFWDDLRAVPIRYRLGVQALAIGLLLAQTGTLPGYCWVGVAWLLAGISLLNAINFMDGINGMTVLYGIVTVLTLWFLQRLETIPALFPAVLIALLIFGYGNVRKRAIWFAGDVGSMSVGFISLYGLLNAINQYQTYLPVLLFAVYGVDTGLTFLHRLWLRQNVLQAHRQHLFQLLVHRAGWSHIRVSGLYALTQLGINALVFLVNGLVRNRPTYAGGWRAGRAEYGVSFCSEQVDRGTKKGRFLKTDLTRSLKRV